MRTVMILWSLEKHKGYLVQNSDAKAKMWKRECVIQMQKKKKKRSIDAMGLRNFSI
jgi:hypothetical protein